MLKHSMSTRETWTKSKRGHSILLNMVNCWTQVICLTH